jgi:hypothetical protein
VALERATLSVEPAVLRWESSIGPMHAHRVHVRVDAARLGALRRSPALEDALRAALAAAISRDPGETLQELVLGWEPFSPDAPYRDPAPMPRVGDEDHQHAEDPEVLRDALAEYLEGSGEPDLANAARRSEITHDAGGAGASELRVWLPATETDRTSIDARTTAILGRALRDLTGDPEARVVVRAQ